MTVKDKGSIFIKIGDLFYGWSYKD
jgi:hypothetical protein